METITLILEVRTPVFAWKNKSYLGVLERTERNRRTGKNEVIRYNKYLRNVELSANSFKGNLRWWYRALLGYSDDLLKGEKELFGSTENAAPFKMKINTIDPIIEKWDDNLDTQTKDRKYSYGQYSYSSGNGNYNGLQYFGYNFYTRSRKNKEIIESEYFAPKTKFELTFFAKDKELLDKILMIFWTLLQFGGVGSRSRRGFGDFKIITSKELILNSDNENFKFKNSYSDLDEFKNTINTNLNILFRNFSVSTNEKSNKITNFKNFSLFLALPIPAQQASKNSNNTILAEKLMKAGFAKTPSTDWMDFINFAGATMQSFRVLKNPDYINVHNFDSLTEIQRAAFGMPLEFKFSNRHDPIDPISIVPMENDDSGRLASPVIISATEINNQLYVQYLLLSFDYSILNVKAKQRSTTKKITIDPSILSEFTKFLLNPPPKFKKFKYREITI